MDAFVTVEDFWADVELCLYDLKYGCGLGRFETAIKLLRKGAEEGDPVLMYLWAEFLLWGSYTSEGRSSGNSILDIMPNDEEVMRAADWVYQECDPREWRLMYRPDKNGCVWDAPDAYQWYIKSAEAGYVPAMCWLAWCAKRGIVIKRDAEESHKWILRSQSYLPAETLLLEELNRFEEAGDDICDAAADADLKEDIAMDQGRPYTGPFWQDLVEASVDPYKMGCMMGSPKCALPTVPYGGLYGSSISSTRLRMCVEKRLWQVWCGLNGIGVKESNPEQLREWMADVTSAMTYDVRPLELDEGTSALLQELTEEVIRLN